MEEDHVCAYQSECGFSYVTPDLAQITRAVLLVSNTEIIV